MKKRWMLLAMGLTLSLTMLAGCSQPAEAETIAPAETAADTQEETVKADEENGPASETESSESAEGAKDVSVLTRIWGTVLSSEEGQMTVDNTSPASSSGEIIFHIDPEHTLVLDAVSGLPVSSEDVELGSFEAYLGPAMTMSLPPQTTPEMVIVNIPADFRVPQYVIADSAPEQDGDGWILKGADGAEYRISEHTQFSPYLTRNIVTMEDIQKGSACLIWQDADGAAERIVIFAR